MIMITRVVIGSSRYDRFSCSYIGNAQYSSQENGMAWAGRDSSTTYRRFTGYSWTRGLSKSKQVYTNEF